MLKNWFQDSAEKLLKTKPLAQGIDECRKFKNYFNES